MPAASAPRACGTVAFRPRIALRSMHATKPRKQPIRETQMGQNGGTSPRGPRCIALVGPFQSGKTTLLEAMLARTGAIPRQGSVEAGSTVGDAGAESPHPRISVALVVAAVTVPR